MELMQHRLSYQSKKHNKVIDKFVFCTDCSGLVLSLDFDVIKYCRATLAIDQMYYPRRLKTIIYFNAPWFINIIFSFVKPFLFNNDYNENNKNNNNDNKNNNNEEQKEKFRVIFVNETNSYSTLLTYIDNSNIPVLFGGADEGTVWSPPYDETSGVSDSQLEELFVSSEK
jgi:hypothetical protein